MADPQVAADRLQAKWTAFAAELEARRTPPPVSLSADDLNAFITDHMPQLTDQMRLAIAGGQVKGQFSVPLAQTGQRKLQGRYFNGLATFDVTFQAGRLDVRTVALEANGKPVPRWILRRIQKHNVLQQLYENANASDVLQRLESVQVKDDQILLTPAAPP